MAGKAGEIKGYTVEGTSFNPDQGSILKMQGLSPNLEVRSFLLPSEDA